MISGMGIMTVEITYNPYQGLKLLFLFPTSNKITVEITYNPYQGLKPTRTRST
ncbi:hypothetical protein PL11201_10030 [Planktothrix sp. PCC 11201]|nr:hypothetical protein PL11201_10030 [Planktothrix sp. PCC 11201]